MFKAKKVIRSYGFCVPCLPAGKLLETNNGWNALFLLWMVLALTSVLVTILCIPLWRKFCRSETN